MFDLGNNDFFQSSYFCFFISANIDHGNKQSFSAISFGRLGVDSNHLLTSQDFDDDNDDLNTNIIYNVKRQLKKK